ncbi:hypothetical protein BWGOE8_11690 [Bacillus mycoides]|uniref:Uncharacterized protein n=1 Tax=Bacillus mycoides TaxID=1405 RepID=A0A1E8BB81_BACMY|nr:hypothetical protein BWGOE8_11690 [Bacillus mycoides]OFD82968.1 hypothetical protein BWGOE9_11360 [Bacillus mycoides]OFD85399.1 hypothetical protein BWGOE10_11510 [Bacillus mycoides]
MVIFVDGYYKGYTNGYKNYKPKKTLRKARDRSGICLVVKLFMVFLLLVGLYTL